MNFKKNMTDRDQLLMNNPLPELSADDETSLNQILKDGMLTRRQAMKWLMAMGVSAFASNILVSQTGEVYAATPKRGARLRVAMHSQSAKDTLDPAKFSFSSDFVRAHSFYNGLTRLNNNAQALPELAESFEPNSDATEWIFKLRKGVTFHDGKTLDADDVVYSIRRHKDPSTGSAANSLANLIENIKSDGKDTVVVKLGGSNADLPILLSTPHFIIIKKGTTDFSTAIGTGPFKVKEFKPGVRTVGVRNENYFKEGRPYMEEHEFFGISDDAARLNALFSGDVHMMTSVNMNSFKDIEARKNVEIFSTPAPRFSQLIMMVDRSPTNNIDLRMAIKNLFNREKVLKSITKNYGQIGNDHVIPPSSPLYNNNLPQLGLDRDKAKYHLKKAGMENARLELHVSPAANLSVELGLLLQQDAAKIGLTIDLKREPGDGYWSNIWRKRSFHAGEWNARPTFDLLLTLGWKSDAKWNETQFKSERMDKLIDEGRATVEFNKRKEIYGEIQKILYEQGGNVIPAFTNYVDAISSSVKGLEPVFVGNLGGFNYADSVWLDI
jgi:peptide/nickel transport system substrate-binding protein